MEVPQRLLEECTQLLRQLMDDDTRNDVGGAYLGEEFLREVTGLYYEMRKTLKNNKLVVRKRAINGGPEYWWVGRGQGKRFTPYRDEYGGMEHGYCSRSKAHAERICAEIEERLHV